MSHEDGDFHKAEPAQIALIVYGRILGQASVLPYIGPSTCQEYLTKFDFL